MQTASLKGGQETLSPLPCTSVALRRRLYLWALEQGLAQARSSLSPACNVICHWRTLETFVPHGL